MAKATQNYKLHEMMKSGEIISKEHIAKTLKVKMISVPVYIHELKAQFKAKIKSVREGRKVTGYQLVLEKGKSLDIPQFRKNSVELQKPVIKKIGVVTNIAETDGDGSVPVIDKDAEITQVSDREFDDIRSSLGVDLPGYNAE